MSDEQKLEVYLEHLRVLALQKIQDEKKDAMTALKESLHIVEGEMLGY